MGDDGLVILIVIVVLIIVLGLFALENFNLVKATIGLESNDEEEEEDSDSLLGEIFYLYSHSSEKEWLNWMNKQNHHTRVKAASMICAHLDGNPKHWGYITLEAIDCLKGFKDLLIDHKIAAFIHKTSKIWQEYKSIPSYYEKAAGVLARINPDSAVEHFKEELDKHSGSQSSLEKKRILINTLPLLREKGKDLIIDILSSQHESFNIKSHALRITLKFSAQTRNEIFLETLKRVVKKHKGGSRGIKTDELHFIQDLVEDCISMIGQKDFFDVFNEACYTFQLQKVIVDSLIKYLNNAIKTPSTLDLYAASLLKDNTQNDIKKALARKHNLIDSEINELVLKRKISDISETSLISIPIEESLLPIPEALQSLYNDFKSLFFKNIDEFEVVTSEKIFGAVLATGNDDIEKLYLTKALAKEKNWNFGFVDIASITTREAYNECIGIFSKLRKPYVLYIKNPELFFMKTEATVDTFREKFAQTLAIQSLDSKSYLVGDIQVKMDTVEHTNLGEAIRHLRYKYFPQTIEINKRPNTDKYKIAEQYMKHVNPHTFRDQQELCTKLSEQGKNLNSIEFMFFAMRTLTTMLLVYGQGVPYTEVAKLEHQFKLTAGKLSPKKSEEDASESEEKDTEALDEDKAQEEGTEEETKESAEEDLTEAQAEQNSELPDQADSEL